MPQPYFTPGKELVRTLQEADWAVGPVWMGGKYITTAIMSMILLHGLFSNLS
jgi:hypothetical protein